MCNTAEIPKLKLSIFGHSEQKCENGWPRNKLFKVLFKSAIDVLWLEIGASFKYCPDYVSTMYKSKQGKSWKLGVMENELDLANKANYTWELLVENSEII